MVAKVVHHFNCKNIKPQLMQPSKLLKELSAQNIMG
jgi:hypothetical protein